MALRNQPYLPLYVQDYLTDEKLNMCSASTQGIYIKIMCVLHKSEDYGKLLLKQKDKQSLKQTENFAYKLAKMLPFTFDIILPAIEELIDEGVLHIENDYLCQKRMIKDEKISSLRSQVGSKGGKKTQFAKAKIEAKSQANTEYETEIETETINRTGRFFKLIPKKFDNNNKFWEAWKNWVDHNELRGTIITPKQAKIQLSYLETHPQPTELLIQAFANDWKGIIYKDKSNGTKGCTSTGATADELATVCTDYVKQTGQK